MPVQKKINFLNTLNIRILLILFVVVVAVIKEVNEVNIQRLYEESCTERLLLTNALMAKIIDSRDIE